MTDEEHHARLDAVRAEISALAAAAFEELMQRISDGEAPREALAAVTATFHGEYAEALAREFGRLLGRPVSPEEIRALPIGEVKLSDKLYRQASETSAVARTIIRNHLQGFQDAPALALKLYEGYQFQDDPLKVTAALPKYLREAMRDPAIDTGLRQLFARIRATNLKTPGLWAAYLQALDAIEKGAGEARLKKLLKVAWYERNRYFAHTASPRPSCTAPTRPRRPWSSWPMIRCIGYRCACPRPTRGWTSAIFTRSWINTVWGRAYTRRRRRRSRRFTRSAGAS